MIISNKQGKTLRIWTFENVNIFFRTGKKDFVGTLKAKGQAFENHRPKHIIFQLLPFALQEFSYPGSEFREMEIASYILMRGYLLMQVRQKRSHRFQEIEIGLQIVRCVKK